MDQLRQQMPSQSSVCFRRCQHIRRWGSEVKLTSALPWNTAPPSDTRPGHHLDQEINCWGLSSSVSLVQSTPPAWAKKDSEKPFM